ncbi:MAG TPA: T9SS type A sorting domain-containing protein [Acidobacteriota bacterium]|nr:T9SS type A sorting domain-containing protein [Acidobacteriota bacterium]
MTTNAIPRGPNGQPTCTPPRGRRVIVGVWRFFMSGRERALGAAVLALLFVPWCTASALASSRIDMSQAPAVRAATVSGSAPTVLAPATIACPEGAQAAFNVSASDIDGDPIISLTADDSLLPTGHNATFTPSMGNAMGTFSWTPGYDQSGVYSVTFTATAGGLSGQASTEIQVEDFQPGFAVEPDPGAMLTQAPIPLQLRPKREPSALTTLSGSFIRQATQTKTYYLYPGACLDRASGMWAPRSSPVADSLNGYGIGTRGGYTSVDRTAVGSLWHIIDSSIPATERPPILFGNYSLWCGTYDDAWGNSVGYPNNALSVLYINTGVPHASTYVLTMSLNISAERDYDFVYLIGGGEGAEDPLGADRLRYEDVVNLGESGAARRLISWTGSIRNGGSVNTTSGEVTVVGSASQGPLTVPYAITIAAEHRALYMLLVSDNLFSSEDGNWPYGNGVVLDNIQTSDNGEIYSEGATSSLVAPRILDGVGPSWLIGAGSDYATSDICGVQKNSATDHFFTGCDPASKNAVSGQSTSLTTCSFPIPPGTGAVNTRWTAYLNLPVGDGYVQWSEYRVYRDGAWTVWANTRASGAVVHGVEETWVTDGDDLPLAIGADSVQVRFNLQCVQNLARDGVCNSSTLYGVLYDDLVLEVVSGSEVPTFGIFPSSVAQSTFVDGTILSRANCGGGPCGPVTCVSPPCWPGIRGSGIGVGAITDNFNSPIGDSVVVSIVSGIRSNGMGINWHRGHAAGVPVLVDNAAYQPSLGAPRMIYRLLDPQTKSWSPFDSTELDADAVVIAGTDTILVGSKFRVDWPPRDKIGLNLPGGFTINGVAAYSSLSFLPRGTRLQYYFKAVDIAGTAVYQFQTDRAANEVADLPLLPGGVTLAPDIIEFDVLPSVYEPGHAGTLLQGRTTTPILYLDGAYTTWETGRDPVIEALRGLGVRVDRYRLLQGFGFGSGIGGREWPGQRPRHDRNYFPNALDYPIADSLAKWYRIVIEATHERSAVPIDESDAALLSDWWAKPTTGESFPEASAGDRCLLVTGNDVLRSLADVPPGEPGTYRAHFLNNVLGLVTVGDSWNGTGSVQYPAIDDKFANPSSGPGLVSGFSYDLDGGCPRPERFDALTKVGSFQATNAALYPGFGGETQVAGVAYTFETDTVTDHDRAKALSYGFTIGAVRHQGAPPSSPLYPHTGIEDRMRVLYKFLTGCRGVRGQLDTLKCWPCPSDPTMTNNWNGSAGFQTSLYGPLYPIQDNQLITGVSLGGPVVPSTRSHLYGNYPNPFNPYTTIRFVSSRIGATTIRIFNIAGQHVRSILVRATPGVNEVRWDGRNAGGATVASGIYFYKIRFADGLESTSRMTLLK